MSELATWLDQCAKASLVRLQLRAPGESLVTSCAIGETDAEQLEADARNDATELPPRAEPYTYRLTASSDDGVKIRAFKLAVRGTRPLATAGDDKAADVVPEKIGSATAALGHVTKALIETSRHNREMADRASQRSAEELREMRGLVGDLLKLTRRLAGQVGEDSMTKIVELEIGRQKIESENKRDLFQGLISVGKGVASKFLPPAAAATTLIESLRPEQLEKLYALLGPKRASALLAARTPEQIRPAVLAIEAAEFPAILDMLDEGQKAIVNRMLDVMGAPAEGAAAGEGAPAKGGGS